MSISSDMDGAQIHRALVSYIPSLAFYYVLPFILQAKPSYSSRSFRTDIGLALTDASEEKYLSNLAFISEG
jgi:hypothetical protein